MINLRLSVYDLDEHAQKWMKRHGITYKKAVPQMMGDQWWFFDCQNVPEKIEKPLSILEGELESFIGYGLSEADVEELQPKQEPAVWLTEEEMWDDLAELGINPELEKESNPDDRVSKADYWFQKYNAMKTAGVDDEEIRDMYDELRINVAKAVFWQDAYATGLREKEDIRVRIVALGITPDLLEEKGQDA